MTDAILRTENLKKSFGKLEVLKGITTEIRRGEVVSIIGPSGGGKSTFLRCLNLLETPDSGQVLFKGQDVTDKKLNIAKYRQSIGMVFQHFNVFPNMTVLENVKVAFSKDIHYGLLDAIFRTPRFWKTEESLTEKAMDLLSIFHLSNRNALIFQKECRNFPVELVILCQ